MTLAINRGCRLWCCHRYEQAGFDTKQKIRLLPCHRTKSPIIQSVNQYVLGNASVGVAVPRWLE